MDTGLRRENAARQETRARTGLKETCGGKFKQILFDLALSNLRFVSVDGSAWGEALNPA
jgi:hypothetical protein